MALPRMTPADSSNKSVLSQSMASSREIPSTCKIVNKATGPAEVVNAGGSFADLGKKQLGSHGALKQPVLLRPGGLVHP